MHKFYKICVILGLILIASALVLCVRNIVDEWHAEKYSESIMDEMKKTRQPIDDDNLHSKSEIPDHILNPNMDMPVKVIDGVEYVGTLEIPVLDLSLPVINQWSYPNLKKAPCRYDGSAYLNNLVIAGHNYQSHFGSLDHLSQGDDVIFTDMDGNRFRYKVAVIDILQPTAIEEMTDGNYALSLFTCTISGQYRATVRCDMVPGKCQYQNKEGISTET